MTDESLDRETSNNAGARGRIPVRGPLALTPALSSPQVTAGTDFSIFATIQNPFDVAVTLYEVQTHLPVELLDVNRANLKIALDAEATATGESSQSNRGFGAKLQERKKLLDSQTGFATAVGTSFSPETAAEMIKTNIQVGSIRGGTVAGVMFNFPENPTVDELDDIFRRLQSYNSGIVPVRLQPGDQIVRQFRLRTKNWLFFTPLTHSFQIQAYFSVDGSDHNCTVTYPVTIKARLPAIAVGGAAGAVTGAVLKMLTQPTVDLSVGVMAQGVVVSLLATLAVVVGFARKSGSQSFVSVEDFWGGALIGFSVGFVGYNQFLTLFGKP